MIMLNRSQIKTKIAHRIVIADILDQSAQQLIVIGIFPAFYPSADQITEHPPKIFMSGIGEKTSGISEHTNKIPQKPQIGKGGHLLCHPCFVIVEPPCAALLDLACCSCLLETAD